jgi:ketosteroid isomerase-like protein
MSSENLDVVRRIIQAFKRQEWATALDGYDEAAELDQSRMPGGGVYHGREEINRFYARWVGSWDEFEVDPVELLDAGDDVIAIMDISGIGRASGAAVKMRAADVYTVVRGKVVKHVAYPDASEAIAEAGMSG